MVSPESDISFYDNEPAAATADRDSKSPSTSSGIAAARSEQFSVHQPTLDEFSEGLVPELSNQVTTESQAITNSSDNYIQEEVIAESGSSDSNLVSLPPPPLEASSWGPMSPRNSAAVTPASVTFSVPVMSEFNREQEQVLMVPKVVTTPSACSDSTAYDCEALMEWEECGPGSPASNKESHPPHPHCVAEVFSTDQSSPFNSDAVVPASVSLYQPELLKEKMSYDSPMECSEAVENSTHFMINNLCTAVPGNIMANNMEQVNADPPPHQEYSWPSDSLCHRCEYLQMSVTLLPCLHAALCKNCADVIMKQRRKRCPFCNQRVTDTIKVNN